MTPQYGFDLIIILPQSTCPKMTNIFLQTVKTYGTGMFRKGEAKFEEEKKLFGNEKDAICDDINTADRDGTRIWVDAVLRIRTMFVQIRGSDTDA